MLSNTDDFPELYISNRAQQINLACKKNHLKKNTHAHASKNSTIQRQASHNLQINKSHSTIYLAANDDDGWKSLPKSRQGRITAIITKNSTSPLYTVNEADQALHGSHFAEFSVLLCIFHYTSRRRARIRSMGDDHREQSEYDQSEEGEDVEEHKESYFCVFGIELKFEDSGISVVGANVARFNGSTFGRFLYDSTFIWTHING